MTVKSGFDVSNACHLTSGNESEYVVYISCLCILSHLYVRCIVRFVVYGSWRGRFPPVSTVMLVRLESQ